MPTDERRTDFDVLFTLPRRTPLVLRVRRVGELRGTLSRTRPGVVILDVGDRERFVPVTELESYALDEAAAARVAPRRSASKTPRTVPSRRPTPAPDETVEETTVAVNLGNGAGRTEEEERFLQYLIGGGRTVGRDDGGALLRRLLDAFLGRSQSPPAGAKGAETTGVVRLTVRRRRGGGPTS